jgi:dihydrofolate reductase
MGAITVHLFTTIDGVIGAPMWTMDYPFTDAQSADTGALTANATAILLGRRTFEEMGPAWMGRKGEGAETGAPFFNETSKHVVSGTLDKAEGWDNSEILGTYAPTAIRAFADAQEGDVYVTGSGTLVRAMLADGLVDALHLFVYPVALSEGPKLFPEGGAPATLRLLAADGYDNGVVHLAYGPA